MYSAVFWVSCQFHSCAGSAAPQARAREVGQPQRSLPSVGSAARRSNLAPRSACAPRPPLRSPRADDRRRQIETKMATRCIWIEPADGCGWTENALLLPRGPSTTISPPIEGPLEHHGAQLDESRAPVPDDEVLRGRVTHKDLSG